MVEGCFSKFKRAKEGLFGETCRSASTFWGPPLSGAMSVATFLDPFGDPRSPLRRFLAPFGLHVGAFGPLFSIFGAVWVPFFKLQVGFALHVHFDIVFLSILAPKIDPPTLKIIGFSIVKRRIRRKQSSSEQIGFWSHFGVVLGSFGLPFGSLWLPFGSLWLPLGSHWAPFGSLLAPFGSLLAPFAPLSAPLWLPLAPCGLPLGSLGLPFVSLGSLFAPFAALWLPFGSLWLPFGSLLAPFWLPLGPLWLPFVSLRLPFGSLGRPFGSLYTTKKQTKQTNDERNNQLLNLARRNARKRSAAPCLQAAACRIPPKPHHLLCVLPPVDFPPIHRDRHL